MQDFLQQFLRGERERTSPPPPLLFPDLPVANPVGTSGMRFGTSLPTRGFLRGFLPTIPDMAAAQAEGPPLFGGTSTLLIEELQTLRERMVKDLLKNNPELRRNVPQGLPGIGQNLVGGF